jgi:hypothetical protein
MDAVTTWMRSRHGCGELPCRPFEVVQHRSHRHLVRDRLSGRGPDLANRLFALHSPDDDSRVSGRPEGQKRDEGHAKTGGHEALRCRVLISLQAVTRLKAGPKARFADDLLAITGAGVDADPPLAGQGSEVDRATRSEAVPAGDHHPERVGK